MTVQWRPSRGIGVRNKQKVRVAIIRKACLLTNLLDGKNKAYFRGRQLEGNSVKVPEGYRGIFIGQCVLACDLTSSRINTPCHE
jgi:hypothetical protein